MTRSAQTKKNKKPNNNFSFFSTGPDLLTRGLLLEILHNHSHPQTQKTNQFSGLVLVHFPHLLHLQTLGLVLNRLSYYLESENLHSSCQVGVHGRSALDKINFFSQSILWRIPNEKILHRIVLAWLHTPTYLTISIRYSALFHQLFALESRFFHFSLSHIYHFFYWRSHKFWLGGAQIGKKFVPLFWWRNSDDVTENDVIIIFWSSISL